MNPCPSDSDFERFHAGTLDAEERVRVRRHVDACPDCQARRAALAATSDGVHPLPDASGAETVTNDTPAATLGMPKRIGQYHIRRVIASGGMGTVYEATQEQPRRVVAVKVMKQGIASKSALRRFEYEAQILARLRHPNIAQIYEAGTHTPDQSRDREGAEGDRPAPEPPAGVPYFAMEYIPNAKPITEYVKHKRLGTRDRLRLFADVCEAVHHGHQKGIIHRDLKPSNILVDSHGRAKVIDFGVARATDSDMAITTLQTDVGQLIGTLQYMSPEQCAADPHDLDTRSDIYALGVVLYELLCERLPYDVSRAAVLEAARVITEQPPTRLSSVNRALRGDVETIVLHAIEKDRERRYESAQGLANDITRYLNSEPISARPPSVLYQVRTFSKRNKALVGGIAAVFVVLVAGIAVSLSLYARAEQSAERSRTEAAKSKQIARFTREMLSGVKPEIAKGMDKRLMRLILDRAAKRIETELSDQPEVEAVIRDTIGQSYMALGEYKTAEPQFVTARDLRRDLLGAEHPDTLVSMNYLADLYYKQGRYAEAEPLLVKTLEIAKRVLGAEHPDTLGSMNNLAMLYERQDRTAEAEPLYVKTLETKKRVLGEEHPDTLGSMENLANVYNRQGRYTEAEPLLVKTLETRKRVLGAEHPDTLRTMNNLANLYCRQGRYAEAEPLYLKTLEIEKRVLGAEHPDTLGFMNNLANLYQTQGRYAEAEPLYVKTLEIRKRVLGAEHPDTLWTMNGLAGLYNDQGRTAEAEPLYVKTLETRKRVLGAEHPDTLRTMNGLAAVYNKQGRPDDARPLVETCLRGVRSAAEATAATPDDLNSAAWDLLTAEPADLRDPQTALEFAVKANNRTDHKNPAYLDTLALAYHRTGDTARALEIEEKAVALLPPGDSPDRKSMEASLEKFRRAAASRPSTTQPTSKPATWPAARPVPPPATQPAAQSEQAAEYRGAPTA